MIKYLAFSAGGVKGLSFIGCLEALESIGLISDIEGFVGSSAGAIMSYLIVIGYTSIELKYINLYLDLTNFRHITSDNIINYLKNFGIDSGENFKKVLRILSNHKNIDPDIDFISLYKKTGKNLVVTGTNLSKQKTDYFCYQTHPNMKVIEAIRISLSIPYVFNVCHFNGDLYVDGAVMENYPINYFNRNEVLGFHINNNSYDMDITTIDSFTLILINCIVKKMQNQNLLDSQDVTVDIINNSSILDFNLTYKQKEMLFRKGYNSTINYIFKNKNRFHKDVDKICSLGYSINTKLSEILNIIVDINNKITLSC